MDSKMLLVLFLCLAVAGCDDSTDPMMSMGDGGPMTASGDDAGSGSTGGGGDAGPGSTGGGGDSCPATLPEVDIQFGGCDALDACGGDPTGTWVYSAACAEDPTADLDLTGTCPQARVEDLEGTARGCVAFDGGLVDRNVSGEISYTVIVPASCTAGLGCGVFETALGTTCEVVGGDCRCPVTEPFGVVEVDGYTVTGSVLTVDGGGQYDFCVSGGTLRYEERGEVAREPGIATLSR